VLPVTATDINSVSVFGGLGAPGHTLPTPHAGMFLARSDVPLVAPGDLAVTELRRVRYLSSPSRPGFQDYAIFFQVCRELTGWFGHVTSLPVTLTQEAGGWPDCDTYSTSDETVEACTTRSLDVKVAAGAPLGRGGNIPLGLFAIDFGILDSRANHLYVSPGRHPPDRFHAVCPWEQFDDANRSLLLGKLRDLASPSIMPAGEPRCGTMEVDVAGTAKGVWAESGVTGQAGGDETRYATLANYPYRPQDMLALSLGPAALGARVAIVPRLTTGRVNRAFEDVSGDGTVYCYGPEAGFLGTSSWLLALSGATLRIEWVSHPSGASPCSRDPTTWTFGASVRTMVR
jgi:hypothetical protein